MEITLLVIGLVVGGVAAWLIAKQKYNRTLFSEAEFKKNKKDLEDLSIQVALEKQKKEDFEKDLTSIKITLQNKEDLQENFNTQRKELKENVNLLIKEKGKSQGFLVKNGGLIKELKKQEERIENINKKFNLKFENIANKILEEKTKKFTDVNQKNLESILKPLGEDIEKFKKKVDDVYNNEAKERFSLGKEIEKLLVLNKQLSADAHNLTNALKGDPKAQGKWGEMILESILEKSGLTKGQEYFMENYLKDDNGNYLYSEAGKKMRPDAIIKYPDNRIVLIDSKVSLNAYTRFVETNDVNKQKSHIKEHMNAIKTHIETLSKRGYDDYEKSLDFVMMFIPNEPAFMIALKEDPDIWHYAYEKRILLISPTNLITSIKLISDLWKREYQNQNTQEIVDRGSLLYDKFVGFTDNLKTVGDSIDKAKKTYEKAFDQLTGHGSLVGQAEKMKALGLKTKNKIDSVFLKGNEIEETVSETKK